jgi:hypothetical protein
LLLWSASSFDILKTVRLESGCLLLKILKMAIVVAASRQKRRAGRMARSKVCFRADEHLSAASYTTLFV